MIFFTHFTTEIMLMIIEQQQEITSSAIISAKDNSLKFCARLLLKVST